jgi:two-component sensor histidine kinase
VLIRIINSFAVSVVLISALVMGLIYYDLLNTKKVVANHIVEHKTNRVVSKLDEFFNPIMITMNTLREHDMYFGFQEINKKELNQYFIPYIKEFSSISSVGIANSDGYELNILPDLVKGYWLNREVFVDEWGMVEKWTRWHKTDDLELVSIWESPLVDDPRNRSWFIGAMERTEPSIFWTEPYIFNTNRSIGVTASLSYDIPKKQKTHILALDITLDDLTFFSQQLSSTTMDEIFILTENLEIIGLSQKFAGLSIEEFREALLIDPLSLGNEALTRLIRSDINKTSSFRVGSETWWGKLKQYPVSESQFFVVATLIPEKEFSYSLDGTRNLMVFGFSIIIILSTLLVVNNRKLRKVGNDLKFKNNQISIQKQHLLSEVHHRVKNNLAIMSALMELENMMIDDPETNRVLTLIQSRIYSMSAVHEILYKTDEYNRIHIQEIMPGVIGYFSKNNPAITISCKNKVQPVKINVNQALTFALLMNELFHYMAKPLRIKTGDSETNWVVQCNVVTEGDYIMADIESNFHLDFKENKDEIGFELIQVLLQQLEATMVTDELENGVLWRISFQLNDKKGITSDRYKFEEA